LAGLRRLLDQGRVVKMGGPLEPARPVQQELHKALGPVSAYGQRFQAFSLAESGVNLFPGAAVYSMMTMHPGSAMAYRVECGGKSVVYCPATEMDPETDERTPSDFNEKLARLVRGADLLIMDARYKDEDYARSAGKGDGCGGRAVELALRRGVRRLLLFRMDARYSEQDLLMWENAIRAELQEQSASLRAEMSKPGLCVEL
jgi:phosphoribosyl 1,2-cyclic phosphodiesterase